MRLRSGEHLGVLPDPQRNAQSPMPHPTLASTGGQTGVSVVSCARESSTPGIAEMLTGHSTVQPI